MGDGRSISQIFCFCYDKCVEPTCGKSIGRCQTAVDRKIGAFLFLEGNWKDLCKNEINLKLTHDAIVTRLKAEGADISDVASDMDVKEWKAQVETQEKNKEESQVQYENIRRCLCGCTYNLRSRCRVGRMVHGRLSTLNNLIAQSKDFPSVPVHNRPPDVVQDQGRPETVGLQQAVAELRNSLRDESIVGIYGMGGIGKSTLLEELHYILKTECEGNPEENLEFSVVIPLKLPTVDLLTDEEVIRLQREICTRVPLRWDPNHKPEERAGKLRDALRRKKRFLVLLDNVWNSYNLEILGIPKSDKDNQGKLVVVSRFRHVCQAMGAGKKLLQVKGLNQAVSMDLFLTTQTHECNEAILKDKVIKSHAEAILSRCKGLPLAIKVIGQAVARTLANPTARSEWNDVREALLASPAGLEGIADDLLNVLKKSYNKLDTVHKRCFLYCALFPYSYSIRKDQLVEYWVSEEIIDGTQGLEASRRVGRLIVNELISACLLEQRHSISYVEMHDKIRDLALWITHDCGEREKNAYMVLSSLDAGQTNVRTIDTRPEKSTEDWKQAERASFMSGNIDNLPDSPNCPALKTLLLQLNPRLRQLLRSFFNNMHQLRVLDLSDTHIKELPIGPGGLLELRHLSLRRTPMTELPSNLGDLKKLSYLDLSETFWLGNIQASVIAGLSKLKVLNVYNSLYTKWKVQESGTSSGSRGDGVVLEDLESLTELRDLGITIQSEEALRKLQQSNALARWTRCLSLKSCRGMKAFRLPDLQKMVSLKEISLHSCYEIKDLVLSDEDAVEAASDLQVLNICVLSNLGRVLAPGVLQNVCELNIESCQALVNTSWIVQLVCLERLKIVECQGMVHLVDGWMSGIGSYQEAFSKLKSVELKDLKNLESICPVMAFPSLETITVLGCLKLRRLPFGARHEMKESREISGFQEWWNALRWDEKELQSKLEKYFQPS